MRSDRVQKLHEILRISNVKAAEYAGIAPSGVGFLRNGKRNPSRESTTTQKYVSGIVRLAGDTGKTQALMQLTGFTLPEEAERRNEALCAALTDWLFEGEEEQRRKEAETAAGFGNRLDAVMTLLGVTNSALCRQIGADPASVSRLRRGLSSPYSSPGLLRGITHILAETAEREGKLDTLERLTGLHVPSIGKEHYTEALLYRWLFDRTQEHDVAVRALIHSVSKHSASAVPASGKERKRTGTGQAASAILKLAGKATSDTDAYYTGKEGLRRAVLRFLSGVVLGHKKELFLYSDQPMEWLTENRAFLKKWSSLMLLCLAHGVKITIIHSIARDMNELVSAISSWMPLYMRGNIIPYYRSTRGTGGTGRTLFLCPGFACINAVIPEEGAENAVYRFDTDKRLLRIHRKTYDAMLSLASPMLEITSGMPVLPTGVQPVLDPDIPDVGICVTEDAAIVVKLSPPVTTLRFLHPLMREAFAAYLA